MAISTYSELQAAITDFMDRADLSGNAEDFITLAEARLNRMIDSVEVATTLTTVSGSAEVDVSALQVIEAIALYETSGEEDDKITYKAPGTFEYKDAVGYPAFYTIDNDNLVFDRPPTDGLTFRFRYRGRFALSDAAPTNDLLTNHPDVYLAASIMWGAVYIRDDRAGMIFKGILDEFMAETKSHLAQRKRSTLSVDPALSSHHRYDRGFYS